jgi:tetratricopeptide (TPR) repeat protein
VVLANLAGALHIRFELSGNDADLDAAVETGSRAVAALPGDHPDRATVAANLGRALRAISDRDSDHAARGEALRLYREAARATESGSPVRMRAASAWGAIAAELGRWDEACRGYAEAVDQLTLMAWHGLRRPDRIHTLRQASGLSADAAALALVVENPAQAVMLLEQGRGVLLTQSLDARTDRSELRALDPVLAEHIDQIRHALDTEQTTL